MVKLPNPATEPTMYFIGVTTGQSSIMRIFPIWAKALGIQGCLKGIDIAIHAPAEDYRAAVEFIRSDGVFSIPVLNGEGNVLQPALLLLGEATSLFFPFERFVIREHIQLLGLLLRDFRF